jgi:hypothetical protein
MKYMLVALLGFASSACNQPSDTTQALQRRIDSLEKRSAESYKPGFGEFMSGIQAHHSKLWFAGLHQNWKLAAFEVHEMMEAVENIKKFQSERKESQLIDLLSPALDSTSRAIQKKDVILFKSSFILLTGTCNKCHRATNFEFNVVKIPETSPFTNQDFKSSP